MFKVTTIQITSQHTVQVSLQHGGFVVQLTAEILWFKARIAILLTVCYVTYSVGNENLMKNHFLPAYHSSKLKYSIGNNKSRSHFEAYGPTFPHAKSDWIIQ